MTDKPMISVIMSVYHISETMLRKSIESILKQTYQNFEFIIALDDPNQTDTWNIIQEYQFKDSRIISYKNITNLGSPLSLNEILKHTKYDYIAHMDDDDISKPTRLEKEIEYLTSHNLDLVGSNAEFIDENGNIMYIINGSVTNYRLYEEFEILHPTWLFKKEVSDKINGYRNVVAADDLDFLIRAHQAGFKFGIVDSILLSYRIRSKSISRSNELRQKYTRLFLLDEYHNNKSPSEQEIINYINSKNLTKTKCMNYSRSRHYYKRSVIASYNKQPIRRYLYFFFSLLISNTARVLFIQSRRKRLQKRK